MAEWKNDGTGTAVDDDVVDDDDDDVKHCVCMYDRSTATLHMFECGEGERERERERRAQRVAHMQQGVAIFPIQCSGFLI